MRSASARSGAGAAIGAARAMTGNKKAKSCERRMACDLGREFGFKVKTRTTKVHICLGDGGLPHNSIFPQRSPFIFPLVSICGLMQLGPLMHGTRCPWNLSELRISAPTTHSASARANTSLSQPVSGLP